MLSGVRGRRGLRMRFKVLPGEECSVKYCRGGGNGINLLKGNKMRRLCEKHWIEFCAETKCKDEIDEWLASHGGNGK